MKIYKKWFLVDVHDKDNPNSLFSFVNESMRPRGKNPFYELNGVKYNVVSKSKWITNKDDVKRAKQYLSVLNKKLERMDEVTLLLKGDLIKQQIKETGYWKYQEIYVEKA